jgi:hypothetical protein
MPDSCLDVKRRLADFEGFGAGADGLLLRTGDNALNEVNGARRGSFLRAGGSGGVGSFTIAIRNKTAAAADLFQ